MDYSIFGNLGFHQMLQAVTIGFVAVIFSAAITVVVLKCRHK